MDESTEYLRNNLNPQQVFFVLRLSIKLTILGFLVLWEPCKQMLKLNLNQEEFGAAMWMISSGTCYIYIYRLEQQLNSCHIRPLLAFCEATGAPLLDNCLWWVILHLWDLSEIEWFSTWIVFHCHTHPGRVWMIELRCFGRNTLFFRVWWGLCDASMCPLCSVFIVFMSFFCLFVCFFAIWIEMSRNLLVWSMQSETCKSLPLCP